MRYRRMMERREEKEKKRKTTGERELYKKERSIFSLYIIWKVRTAGRNIHFGKLHGVGTSTDWTIPFHTSQTSLG